MTVAPERHFLLGEWKAGRQALQPHTISDSWHDLKKGQLS